MIIDGAFGALTVVVAALAVFFAGWYAHMEFLDWHARHLRKSPEFRAIRDAWSASMNGAPVWLDEPGLRIRTWRPPYDWERDGL